MNIQSLDTLYFLCYLYVAFRCEFKHGLSNVAFAWMGEIYLKLLKSSRVLTMTICGITGNEHKSIEKCN